MLKKIFVAFAVMIFIFSAKTSATAAEDNVITVTGSAVGPIGTNSNGSFYRSFARQAAKLDALCQLVELTLGVQIDSVATQDEDGKIISDKVQSKTTFDEKFWSKHFSKIEIVNVKFLSDGGCEVTMKGTLK